MWAAAFGTGPGPGRIRAGRPGRVARSSATRPARRLAAMAARCGLAFALWLAAGAAQAQAAGTAATEGSRWVLVDTGSATLTVFVGGEPRLVLRDIAIGRYGTSADKRRGDGTTPTGRFRIRAIHRDSRFHRFIALDYPDLPRALRARQQGLVDQRQWHAIAAAHARSALPPQHTPLGGHIGIHGLGRGDPEVHASFNWTLGCVALTDAQVDALLDWVAVGTLVDIRPPRSEAGQRGVLESSQ